MINTKTKNKRPALAFDNLREVEIILFCLRCSEDVDQNMYNEAIFIIDELEKVRKMFGGQNEISNKIKEEKRNGKQTCKTCID
tara:strand:- start:16952 stop:17200 length:249 start_codon:yes stop_codon:yes gene_type:complete